MANEKKVTVVGENDSVNTDVNENVEWVKASELSIEEIKKLETFPVTFRKVISKNKKTGVKTTTFSMKLVMAVDFFIEDRIEHSDFFNFVYAYAKPIKGLATDLNSYTVDCPVRCSRGNYQDEETGDLIPFIQVDIFVLKDCIYRMFINKRSHKLNLFETMVKTKEILIKKIFVKPGVDKQGEVSIAFFEE